MKRLVMLAIIKLCGKVLTLTIIAGIVIGVIGYLNKWETTLAYSNAFFIAGCLLFIAGAMSRAAAGQEWTSFQSLYAESFREMSSAERANFIIHASSSLNLLILGIVSGILCLLISILVTKLF